MKKIILLLLLAAGSLSAQPFPTALSGTGEFDTLFVRLERQLTRPGRNREVVLGKKPRTVFVPWIRDHIHVMKAMKYFSNDIGSLWAFFMEKQTAEGLYFDYYYPIASDLNHRMNIFEKRYWTILSQEARQMHRLPVEADLEYLMVEGAYDVWQATGDTTYLRPYMAGLEKGMHYAMTDPLRWSEKYQLVKRGYTLDTWDFMQLPVSSEEYKRQGKDFQDGIFNIGPDTPMGIMHGDNSGMFAACTQLAALYTALQQPDRADHWQKQADHFRRRTNEVCWNGQYYAHFVEDDPMPPYLNMDQRHTLSLSNPYNINRGLPTSEMARSIIEKYRSLKDTNSLNSFAEWFGIYPPVEPQFADYKPGSYMNGGVNTIVAGELAKAAFRNGYEAYGADIMRRLLKLTDQHGGKLPVAYRPDGQVDEGIPDVWGQAAVMSALIEGMAGVTDLGAGFEAVELAPRWLAAGQDSASVTVAYGQSGKHVRYTYRHLPGKRQVSLRCSGDPARYTVRLLLPDGRTAKSALVNGKRMPFSTERIGDSAYAVVDGLPAGSHDLRLTYR